MWQMGWEVGFWKINLIVAKCPSPKELVWQDNVLMSSCHHQTTSGCFTLHLRAKHWQTQICYCQHHEWMCSWFNGKFCAAMHMCVCVWGGWHFIDGPAVSKSCWTRGHLLLGKHALDWAELHWAELCWAAILSTLSLTKLHWRTNFWVGQHRIELLV